MCNVFRTWTVNIILIFYIKMTEWGAVMTAVVALGGWRRGDLLLLVCIVVVCICW